MIKRFRHLFLAVLLMACTSLPAAQIIVFAATSLTDALKEAAVDYGKQSHDIVVFNFGTSSMLARQIAAAAPADIFFTADEATMNDLQGKGLVDKTTRKSRLSNTLVMIVPNDSKLALTAPQDLADPRVTRVALADPQTVPAGIYAKTYLEQLQLWKFVGPKIVPAENVRAALAAVASGNMDAGIVYKTDAAISKQVKVVYELPTGDGPDISYPVALLRGSKQPEAAGKFLEYLLSEKTDPIFKKYGFILRK